MSERDRENRAKQQHSIGFPPIAAPDAQTLILGSLPGQKSLQATEYYAHPQNAFWRIMGDLFAVDGDYDSRCEQLMRKRIAVWDVLASSVRPGSMDASIELPTAAPNNFAGFLSQHRSIERICFNGKKAEQLFFRLVAPLPDAPDMAYAGLPSTSPAYAAMSYEKKRDAWRGILCP